MRRSTLRLWSMSPTASTTRTFLISTGTNSTGNFVNLQRNSIILQISDWIQELAESRGIFWTRGNSRLGIHQLGDLEWCQVWKISSSWLIEKRIFEPNIQFSSIFMGMQSSLYLMYRMFCRKNIKSLKMMCLLTSCRTRSGVRWMATEISGNLILKVFFGFTLLLQFPHKVCCGLFGISR